MYFFHLELGPLTHTPAWAQASSSLSPLEPPPPTKFLVCPHPRGTLSKFTLGQSFQVQRRGSIQYGVGVVVGEGAG